MKDKKKLYKYYLTIDSKAFEISEKQYEKDKHKQLKGMTYKKVLNTN